MLLQKEVIFLVIASVQPLNCNAIFRDIVCPLNTILSFYENAKAYTSHSDLDITTSNNSRWDCFESIEERMGKNLYILNLFFDSRNNLRVISLLQRHTMKYIKSLVPFHKDDQLSDFDVLISHFSHTYARNIINMLF